MASEMRAIGIDMSFAPVLDLDRGNRVIGERAFSADPAIVSRARLRPICAACGWPAWRRRSNIFRTRLVAEDTHFEAAIDPRSIWTNCAKPISLPFADGIDGRRRAVMMAHVTYPASTRSPPAIRASGSKTSCAASSVSAASCSSDDISMAADRIARRHRRAHRGASATPAAISCSRAARRSCPKRSPRAGTPTVRSGESRRRCRARSRRRGQRSSTIRSATVSLRASPRSNAPAVALMSTHPRLARCARHAPTCVHDRAALDAAIARIGARHRRSARRRTARFS